MIYFDNSATTLPYKEAVDSFIAVTTKYFGNPSSLHGLGAQAEKLLTQARKQAASLLEVKEQEIFFTSGGTEGNNIAIKGAALANQSKGKHLIVSSIEHDSVKQAAEQMKELGFEVTYLPVTESGHVEVEALKNEMRPDTILVSVMHVNNEMGAIQPIEEIGKLLKEYPKTLFHVDHIQGVGKVPLSLKGAGIDLCTISAHKFHGLKGTGALYIREGVNIFPLFSGGSQEKNVRSGTENVAGAVALAKALRMCLEASRAGNRHLKEISSFLRRGLEDIEGIRVNSPEYHCAPHILNFSVPGIKTEVLIHALEEDGIYVSTTSACSSKRKTVSDTILMMTNDEGLASSSIRISLSYENTMKEAKEFLETIRTTLKKLKEVMG